MNRSIKETHISFSITLKPCEEGGYFAKCPILQGCHAEGETYGEAIDNMVDVIKAHIETKIKNGEPLPFAKIKNQDIDLRIPVPVRESALAK